MKSKNKFDFVKLKGLIGIFLFISIVVFAKVSKPYLTSEMRYYIMYILLFLGGFSLWLATDYIKTWFKA